MFIYYWERETQSVSRGGIERGGDTESEAGSRLWAVSTEPDTVLELTICEIMTWAEVSRLTNWAIQAPLYFLLSNSHVNAYISYQHLVPGSECVLVWNWSGAWTSEWSWDWAMILWDGNNLAHVPCPDASVHSPCPNLNNKEGRGKKRWQARPYLVKLIIFFSYLNPKSPAMWLVSD